MTDGYTRFEYNTRFERRDLVLAIITAVIGAAAVVMAAVGVFTLSLR